MVTAIILPGPAEPGTPSDAESITPGQFAAGQSSQHRTREQLKLSHLSTRPTRWRHSMFTQTGSFAAGTFPLDLAKLGEIRVFSTADAISRRLPKGND